MIDVVLVYHLKSIYCNACESRWILLFFRLSHRNTIFPHLFDIVALKKAAVCTLIEELSARETQCLAMQLENEAGYFKVGLQEHA